MKKLIKLAILIVVLILLINFLDFKNIKNKMLILSYKTRVYRICRKVLKRL